MLRKGGSDNFDHQFISKEEDDVSGKVYMGYIGSLFHEGFLKRLDLEIATVFYRYDLTFLF